MLPLSTTQEEHLGSRSAWSKASSRDLYENARETDTPLWPVPFWLRRYSKDKPRLGDTLEVIKFVCKDFWQAVFKKQVDNLKTNHRVSR